jgi:hypothetical protein
MGPIKLSTQGAGESHTLYLYKRKTMENQTPYRSGHKSINSTDSPSRSTRFSLLKRKTPDTSFVTYELMKQGKNKS